MTTHETEDRQAVLNLATEWAFAAFVQRQMKHTATQYLFKRCDAYAGEMSGKWARQWGSSEEAASLVAGFSIGQVARAFSRLAEVGRCVIIDEDMRNRGWSDEPTPAIRKNITLIG